MDDKLFSRKIRYLYKKLNLKEREFTMLFFSEKRDSFTSRHTTVHKSWLEKGIKQVKGFYFDEYKISTRKIGEEVAFTKERFVRDSFEEFKERVDKYINYISKPKKLFEYKYIYYFDANLNTISFTELRTLERIDRRRYRVELIPSEFYRNKGVETYLGILKISKDYYHISVENSFEILTFYFMLNKGYTSNKKVNGIGLGLSYERGLPLSTKDLLTKEKLTQQEEQDFYLNANESEYLLSDENFDSLYLDTKTNYLNKFHHKLNNLNIFMNKVRKEILEYELSSDVYLNIFHKSFESINEISKKVQREHYYFVSRRRMATEVFLKSIATTPKSSCRIVYPLFKGDSTLFYEHDERAKRSLNLNIKLVQDGLKIERIFIVNKEYLISDYLKKSIHLLEESGVSIKIAFIEDFESLNISSYDFVYSLKHNVAIYKNNRDRICLYKVTKVKDRIKQLTYDYDKIEEVSYSFEKFLSSKSLKSNKILEKLIGTWHYYAYGSLIVNRDEFKLWHSTLEIYRNGSVEYKYHHLTQHLGEIDTHSNTNQSYIRLTNLESSNLVLFVIDNHVIVQNIFKVTMLRKQYGTMLDMISFGIFSRKELHENLVKKALGNINEVMLRENTELEKRINELNSI